MKLKFFFLVCNVCPVSWVANAATSTSFYEASFENEQTLDEACNKLKDEDLKECKAFIKQIESDKNVKELKNKFPEELRMLKDAEPPIEK